MSRDPFAHDQQRRTAVTTQICDVRSACAQAVEAQDRDAALKALNELYALMDKLPDAQLLYVPGGESESFVLPDTARQMTARWGGFCGVCEDRIAKGDMMYWVRDTREMVCTRCSIKEFHGG